MLRHRTLNPTRVFTLDELEGLRRVPRRRERDRARKEMKDTRSDRKLDTSGTYHALIESCV